MNPTSYDNPERDRRFVSRGSTPESRQRAQATRARVNAKTEAKGGKVRPYLIRGAISPIVSLYTGLGERDISTAKSWLKRKGLLEAKSTPEAASMASFDTYRLSLGMTPELRGMIGLGRQLVEKGVLTEDVSSWQLMLEEYRLLNLEWEPLEGFPEKLILEGYFVSQLKSRQNLDVALRRELVKGGLMDQFEPEFDILTKIAERKR